MSREKGDSKVKQFKSKKKEALWLTSFTDLALILMCFFALMLSMSKPNVQQYDKVVEAIKINKHQKPQQNLEMIYKEIKMEIAKKKLQDSSSVTLDENGLAVEFKNALLFGSGSAVISSQFSQVTSSIVSIIAKSPPKYSITIEGHTDDTPIGSHPIHTSNWHLSAARGISILENFKARAVSPLRMKVVALADTKPRVAITGKIGKELQEARAANRRVVIRIE